MAKIGTAATAVKARKPNTVAGVPLKGKTAARAPASDLTGEKTVSKSGAERIASQAMKNAADSIDVVALAQVVASLIQPKPGDNQAIKSSTSGRLQDAVISDEKESSMQANMRQMTAHLNTVEELVRELTVRLDPVLSQDPESDSLRETEVLYHGNSGTAAFMRERTHQVELVTSLLRGIIRRLEI